MKKIIIFLIKFYQVLPLHTHSSCRFYPTCSNYAIEALEIHGTVKGSILAFKRILRCNPFNKKSGIDFVPPKNSLNNK